MSREQTTVSPVFIPHIPGRRAKIKTRLIASHQFRCNGHLHKVGLASNGQLWIPRHTPTDLKNFRALNELGGDGAKCANMLTSWREKNFISENLPDRFRHIKLIGSEMAARIQRQLQRKYGWPDFPLSKPTEFVAVVVKKNSWGNEYKDDMNEHACTVATQASIITNTLRDRGWPNIGQTHGRVWLEEQYHLPKDDEDDEPHTSTEDLVCVTQDGNWHIHRNRILISSEPEAKDLNFRLAINLAEEHIILHMLKILQNRGLSARKHVFEKACDDALGWEGPVPGASIKVYPDKGVATLTITHENLTAQTLRMLLRHYKQTEQPVINYLRANELRLKAPNRILGPAKRPFGPLKKVKDDHPDELAEVS